MYGPRSLGFVALSLRSVIPVWIAVAFGAVAVGVFAPHAPFVWMPVVMACGVLLTFTIQLGLARKEGLVERIIASLGGAFTLLALATLVLWLTIA